MLWVHKGFVKDPWNSGELLLAVYEVSLVNPKCFKRANDWAAMRTAIMCHDIFQRICG